MWFERNRGTVARCFWAPGRASISPMRGFLSRVVRAFSVAVAVWLAGSVLAQSQAGAGEPAPPKLTFAFELRAQVGPPTEVGQVTHGRRRIVPILGGTVRGPQLNAKVLPAAPTGR